MSDTLETNGEGGDVLDPNIREQLRQSKEHQRAAEESNARAEAAERRAAFAEVGIPTTGVGKLFRDTYSGDPDPLVVKAAAEEYGILGGSAEQGNDGITPEERAAMQRVAGAGTGLPPAGQDYAAQAMAEISKVPYDRMNPQAGIEAVMDIVKRTEAEHPEVGRFTNPN